MSQLILTDEITVSDSLIELLDHHRHYPLLALRWRPVSNPRLLHLGGCLLFLGLGFVVLLRNRDISHPRDHLSQLGVADLITTMVL